MISTETGTIHAATILNCDSKSINRIEYWNVRQNKSGYWQHEKDVRKYATLQGNGSILVSCYVSKNVKF